MIKFIKKLIGFIGYFLPLSKGFSLQKRKKKESLEWQYSYMYKMYSKRTKYIKQTSFEILFLAIKSEGKYYNTIAVKNKFCINPRFNVISWFEKRQ